MAKLLLVGGLPENVAEAESTREFVRAVAREVISQMHVLLGGCQTELDHVAAEAAELAAKETGRAAIDCIISYCGKGAAPIHAVGSVRQSALPRWDILGPRLIYPEPIKLADAVILIGGWEGTHRAANWARIAGKPLLPVATFRLAAAEIYNGELEEFELRYASRVTRNDFELLNTVLPDRTPEKIGEFARQVVGLAERIITPHDVFVIMSFAADPELEDAYDTFVEICEQLKFNARRIDQHLDENKRIVPEIIEAIRCSAFVIADVSELKVNVFYELGWAQALGKPVIVTAKEGTQLPFDIYDVPTLMWKNQRALRDGLNQRIQRIASRFGR